MQILLFFLHAIIFYMQMVIKLFKLLIFSIFILKSILCIYIPVVFLISIFTFHPIYWHILQIWQKTGHCWCRFSINIFFWLNHSISSMLLPCWALCFVVIFLVLNELYILLYYDIYWTNFGSSNPSRFSTNNFFFCES